MTAELRVLTVDDTPALTAAMARAVEAGDMQASSDPAGAFVMKSFAVDPGLFGGAFEDGALVGFVSIGIFVTVVSAVVWMILKATMGIRVDEETEINGLDMGELGMEAYPEFAKG